jgi:Ca2+-transporting ATPase
MAAALQHITVSAGLTSAEAARRLAADGPNALAQTKGPSCWARLLQQFKSPVVLLLLGACVVSALLRELTDAVAIGTIVVLNALVGFFQEYRAEREMQALRAMTAPRARVRRDGATLLVPASEVVHGDLLLLDAGDVVAADAELLEAHRLATNEAPLTGESTQVEKSTGAVPVDAPLAERHDRVFMGTAVATGTGVAEVVSTGMGTELGKIAGLLASAEDTQTPLQQQLARVGRLLLFLCLGLVVLVAVVDLWRGTPLFDVFLSAVSLAVAAVPEGLPAIVTIALAIGVQRMAARHVLVRRLPAVETLGCATVICTDKTGTLTTGVMTVRELWGPDAHALLDAAAACCDADLDKSVGDTTELALLRAAEERGIRRSEIEQRRPRVSEEPFDSQRKRMSIWRADGVRYEKGALEVLLPRCIAGTEGATEAQARLAARGLRVLAVAIGHSAREEKLTLLGLAGIADPPRPEAIAAVAAAREAGITTVMITGDHPLTANAIARELGVLTPGTSSEGRVHARATPEDKLRLVREWKAKGAVVAMTGDGVNDAPALREAHIGVCMGKTGTDVAREASDMVLTDDNFASIVAAVHEGRGIFDDIRRALVYLLIGGAGELALMLAASVAGLPPPLLPTHLLWINLVGDGLPALGLVLERADRDVMGRAPRRPEEPILGIRQWLGIGGIGLLEAGLALGVFFWALRSHSENEARTLAFSVFVFSHVLRAFASRSATQLFWEVGAVSNLVLVGIVIVSVLVQVTLTWLPATRALFHLAPLSVAETAGCLALGLVSVTLLELLKLVRRAANSVHTHRGQGAGTPIAAP